MSDLPRWHCQQRNTDGRWTYLTMVRCADAQQAAQEAMRDWLRRNCVDDREALASELGIIVRVEDDAGNDAFFRVTGEPDPPVVAEEITRADF